MPIPQAAAACSGPQMRRSCLGVGGGAGCSGHMYDVPEAVCANLATRFLHFTGLFLKSVV